MTVMVRGGRKNPSKAANSYQKRRALVRVNGVRYRFSIIRDPPQRSNKLSAAGLYDTKVVIYVLQLMTGSSRNLCLKPPIGHAMIRNAQYFAH